MLCVVRVIIFGPSHAIWRVSATVFFLVDGHAPADGAALGLLLESDDHVGNTAATQLLMD